MTSLPFDGFDASVFEAYQEKKWSSNVFTRERLEAKQRLLSLARSLHPVLVTLGLDLELQASDEYPSLWNQKKVDAQWVFFWRSPEERMSLEAQVDLDGTLAATLADPTPLRRHAFLCLKLEADALELSFRVHRDAWVDRRNLANKVATEAGLDALVDLLQGLAEPIVIGDGEKGCAPGECGADTVAELASQQEDGSDFFRVGLVLSRDEVVAQGSSLSEFFVDRIEGLARLYSFAAWSGDNDFVRTDEAFERNKAARDARRDALDADSEKWKSEREERQKEQEAARRELEEQFRREAVARRQRPVEDRPPPTRQPNEPAKQAERKRPGEAKDEPRRASRPKEQRAPKPAPATPAEPIPVEVGHSVRVVAGPLAGQVGVVQDLDAKGQARVMVGVLASRMSVDDLIGLGPQRPSGKSFGRDKKPRR